MEAGPAALLSLAIVLLYLRAVSTKNAANVAFVRTTSIWPIGTVILAVGAAFLAGFVAVRAGLSGIAIVLIAGGVGFLFSLVGRITNGTRVQYDRGGRKVAPHEVSGALVGFALLFVAFTRGA